MLRESSIAFQFQTGINSPYRRAMGDRNDYAALPGKFVSLSGALLLHKCTL